MADIGSLVVRIAADASSLHKEFARLGSSSQDFGAKMATAGKLAAGAIIAATSALTANALAIAKQTEETEQMSQKTGISVQTLQSWSVIMAENSVKAETLATATKKLSQEIIAARNPSSQAAETFQALGLSITSLGSTEDVIRSLADRFQSMPDGAEKSALAVQLFGKSGMDMIPILNRGAKAFDESTAAARSFGLVLSNDQVKALTAVDDASDRLGMALQGLRTAFALAFAPTLEATLKRFTELFRQMRMRIVDLKAEMPNAQELVGQTMVEEFVKDWKASEEERQAFEFDFQGELGKRIRDRSIMEFRNLEARKRAEEALGRTQLAIIQRTNKEENEAFAERVLEAERLQSLSEGLGQGNLAARTGGAFEDSVKHIREAQRNLAEIWGARGMDPEDAISVMVEQETEGRKVVEAGTQAWLRRNEEMQANVIIADSVERQQQVLFQAEQGMIGAADAARQVAFEANEQRYALETAALKEQYDNRVIGLMEYNARVHALDFDRETKRRQIVQQYPGFWEKQLNDLQASNVFSMGQMVSTWSNAIATMIVRGGDFKAAIEATKIAVVQAFINMAVSSAAAAAKSFLVNEASAAGTAGVWAAAGSFIVGVWGTVTSAMTAMFGALVGIITAVGTAIMGVLTAIAEALTATIWGIPYAGAILVGVGLIAASLLALKAVKFAEGGIVTGPTLGLVGEAGPEAIIPLDRAGSMLGGGQQPIHTTISIDGKKFMKAVSRYTASGWRAEGAPA